MKFITETSEDSILTFQLKAYTRSKRPRHMSTSKVLSSAQPSNPSRRHSNKQENEKDWQGRNTEENSFTIQELHRPQMSISKPPMPIGEP
ncbi:hypothetical protein TNIN_278421 [Trichonephila inaurata madagascariensis]|uniref:Uncharacterized protein n=1 Tax=Trichonephila inaurata madagascariensis TaxID=2747483 RepID=A0A8X6X7C8_9ARAC|nr:hypothetical protein TNIN_278421 [Trichonephila inaurata madagascariensis]